MIRDTLAKSLQPQGTLVITIDGNDVFKHGRTGAQRTRFRDPKRIGNQQSRTGIREPISNGINSEQSRERHRNRADLVDGEMGDRHIAALGQMDRHTVTPANSQREQRLGKTVGGSLHLAIGDHGLAELSTDLDHRWLAGRHAGMGIAARLGHVELRRNMPPEAGQNIAIGRRRAQHGRHNRHRTTPEATSCRCLPACRQKCNVDNRRRPPLDKFARHLYASRRLPGPSGATRSRRDVGTITLGSKIGNDP